MRIARTRHSPSACTPRHWTASSRRRMPTSGPSRSSRRRRRPDDTTHRLRNRRRTVLRERRSHAGPSRGHDHCLGCCDAWHVGADSAGTRTSTPSIRKGRSPRADRSRPAHLSADRAEHANRRRQQSGRCPLTTGGTAGVRSGAAHSARSCTGHDGHRWLVRATRRSAPTIRWQRARPTQKMRKRTAIQHYSTTRPRRS